MCDSFLCLSYSIFFSSSSLTGKEPLRQMLEDGKKLLKKARDDLKMLVATVDMIYQNVTILNLYVCCSKYL